MELGDLIEGLIDDSLMEGTDWNEILSARSRKRNMKKIVVQRGQQVKIHLGKGLNFGDGWGSYRGYYYGKKAHFLELTGPLTAYEVLKALGEAQLFACIRYEVLIMWLARHMPGDRGERDSEEGGEVWSLYSLPLMPEWAKLYEGTQLVMGGRSFTFRPDTIRTLDPPAEFDPIANKSLEEIADLMGGKERAIDYINSGGSTWFLGLTPGPPSSATAAEGSDVSEWTMEWSQAFC